MKTPLNRYTFKNRRILRWVEDICEGTVLNLFSGKTLLSCNEIINDIREEMPADYHRDALEFVISWSKICGKKFNTILLDPPYSYRKSMEMYDGKKMSPFNAIKNRIPSILYKNGILRKVR